MTATKPPSRATDPAHLAAAELNAGLEEIRRSPRDEGIVELIVRRPETEQREVLDEAELDPDHGLVGDNWRPRGSKATANGSAHPGMQLNIMNARAIALIARSPERRPLAGDQLYIDLDLSAGNLPPGTRLTLGTAMIEVTEMPHTGCKKFMARFGVDALEFVNTGKGKELNLRGINARVVRGGVVRVGDLARKQ